MNGQALLNQIDGALDEQTSAALCHYYLNNSPVPGIINKEDIYQHLLLDVNVHAEVKTTRLMEAIGSHQLFISRAIYNQEKEHGIKDLEKLKKKWEELKHYRYWEANERIALFPSQFIEPGMFKDSSTAYQRLDEALSQGKLSGQILSRAMSEYTKSFNKILDIETLWISTENTGSDKQFVPEYTYHLGYARGQSEDLYLRKVKHHPTEYQPVAWEPWQPLNVTLTAKPSELLACCLFQGSGRLYLFCFEKENIAKKEGGDTNLVSFPEYNIRITYTQQDSQGNWSEFYHLQTFPWKGMAINAQGVEDPASSETATFKILGAVAQGNKTDLGGIVFKLRERDNYPRVLTIRSNAPWLSVMMRPTAELANLFPGTKQALCEQAPMTVGDGQYQLLQALFNKNVGLPSSHTSQNAQAQFLVCRRQQGGALTWQAEAIYAPNLRDIMHHPHYQEIAKVQQFDLPVCALQGQSLGNITLAPLTYTPKTAANFSGPFGRYLWEVFFYLPLRIANAYQQARQYDEALAWYAYLFDPSKEGDAQWPVLALKSQPSPWVFALNDPDDLARLYPVHYKKLLVSRYIQCLIERGDALYRQPTRENLREAKMWYTTAQELMGMKPVLPYTAPTPLSTLGEVRAPSADENGSFYRPADNSLLEHWNKLSTRLGTLRRSQDIDGKPLGLPLLDAPISSTQLRNMAATGKSLNNLSSTQIATFPHYRYVVLRDLTNGYLNQLANLGQRLQNVLERQDSESQLNQQYQTQQALAALGKEVLLAQQIQQKETEKVWTATVASTEQRIAYYQKLVTEGISSQEQMAIDLGITSGALMSGASVAFAVGSALSVMPNIFGLACGGMEYAGISNAIGHGLSAGGTGVATAAAATERHASYERRMQEWLQLLAQTQDEKRIQEANKKAAQAQSKIITAELRRHEAQMAQTEVEMQMLGRRFSTPQMCTWMTSQLKAMCYKVYYEVMNLCLQTEKAYQLETGSFQKQYIGRNHWDTSSFGLLSAEALYADMQRMDAAYLMRNQRRLEIHKTISLKAIEPDAIRTLKERGKISFAIAESLFNDDYPNHVCRQIKTVSLSFPAVLKPYQNISATLTQSYNKLTVSNTESITNIRHGQQVAISQGMDDSGLFQLDFNDPRYLPFEGTGVDSRWELDFPGWHVKPSDELKSLLSSLTDVIIHIRYTAKSA
ncbi:neuraminidase-like domain-containing protein [Aeromonas sp. S12(2024)]|uniref:Tc toxin subunit A-related protein n=1 Tax=Aeromonas sp. S12(2024) TaxID=3242885 RepID=UPI0035276104